MGSASVSTLSFWDKTVPSIQEAKSRASHPQGFQLGCLYFLLNHLTDKFIYISGPFHKTRGYTNGLLGPQRILESNYL